MGVLRTLRPALGQPQGLTLEVRLKRVDELFLERVGGLVLPVEQGQQQEQRGELE
jgi:hypothetical protein